MEGPQTQNNNDHAREDHVRKCWGTAKERERNRARYLIRQRVVVHADADDNPDQTFQRDDDSDHEDRIPHFMQHVIQGDKSAFSVCAMEENVHLFQSAHSTSRWLDWEAGYQRLTTIVTSKFGQLHCQELKEYCSDDLATFTFIEFASWLGQYAMVASLIKGGISPTVRSHYKTDEVAGSDLNEWQLRAQDVGALIMEKFFDNFPIALSTYIVKRVTEMRWQSWKSWKRSDADNEISSSGCVACQTATPPSYRLCFGLPCMHTFCEVCFWKHILATVDQRGFQEDVVSCPSCGSISSPHLPVATFNDESPSSRLQSSLAKFQSLPASSRELRSRPKQEKKKKGVLATSWAEAVMSSLGNSKDIRLEKFLSYAERRNTFHYIHGCLVAGVDVNAQNEYGQTALYLAAWRGNAPLVQLLLEYGADPSITATGGISTIQSICVTCGHNDIIEILSRFQDAAFGTRQSHRNIELHHPLAKQLESLHVDPQPLVATILIPTSCEHPGAGSYVVDNAVPADVIDQIVELWGRLPVDDATAAEKFKKKNKCCSNRSYYCDAEGWLSAILMHTLNCANLIHPDTTNVTDVIFPHMRFLHYEHAGTDLAPHVDLSRVSPLSGLRSTHTFILYLSDCGQGGETVLLQELSEKNKIEMATIAPARGMLLLFPHSCPHKGNAVVDVPKLLVRGEIRLSRF